MVARGVPPAARGTCPRLDGGVTGFGCDCSPSQRLGRGVAPVRGYVPSLMPACMRRVP